MEDDMDEKEFEVQKHLIKLWKANPALTFKETLDARIEVLNSISIVVSTIR